jgi:two-component system, NtrC family, nitrogen regulation response regulator NtrX
VLDRLKQSFGGDDTPITDGETGLRLLEAVRGLAVRHGSPAVDHCLILIESLRDLLDSTHG